MAELKVKSKKYNDADVLEVEDFGNNVVESLKGKDINVNGITSKGIANTGNIANIGDIATTGKITGGEIIENMSGYSFEKGANDNYIYEFIYAGVVKTGNKITFVLALNLTKQSGAGANPTLGNFTVPTGVLEKLFPTQIGTYSFLDVKLLPIFKSHTEYVSVPAFITKGASLSFVISNSANMVQDTKYYVRYEATFLLSESLVPSGE